MDPLNQNRSRNRKAFAAERFLGVLLDAPPLVQDPIATNDELQEDEVLFFNDYYDEPSHHNSSTPSSSSSSSAATPNCHHSFGILAALPENKTSSPNLGTVSKFLRRASASSSRMIPSIPKNPQNSRLSVMSSLSSPPSTSVQYAHSAPVDIPMLSEAVKERWRQYEAEAEYEDDGEMLPPHEFVARKSARTPILSCSVMEGVGRTLKGRDLRQVRNAVFRQTGFID